MQDPRAANLNTPPMHPSTPQPFLAQGNYYQHLQHNYASGGLEEKEEAEEGKFKIDLGVLAGVAGSLVDGGSISGFCFRRFEDRGLGVGLSDSRFKDMAGAKVGSKGGGRW